MIDLPTDNPKFSMEMELLCSLPVYPHVARDDSLCEDLGITKTRIDKMVETLRGTVGVKVYRKNNKGYTIAKSQAGLARHKGDQYWRTVYGSNR